MNSIIIYNSDNYSTLNNTIHLKLINYFFIYTKFVLQIFCFIFSVKCDSWHLKIYIALHIKRNTIKFV